MINQTKQPFFFPQKYYYAYWIRKHSFEKQFSFFVGWSHYSTIYRKYTLIVNLVKQRRLFWSLSGQWHSGWTGQIPAVMNMIWTLFLHLRPVCRDRPSFFITVTHHCPSLVATNPSYLFSIKFCFVLPPKPLIFSLKFYLCLENQITENIRIIR